MPNAREQIVTASRSAELTCSVCVSCGIRSKTLVVFLAFDKDTHTRQNMLYLVTLHVELNIVTSDPPEHHHVYCSHRADLEVPYSLSSHVCSVVFSFGNMGRT